MEPREVTLHGHRLSYRAGGSGPVLVLIHGITASAATWDDVLPWLAERHTVVAPDLLGHGRSAKPRGDYSLGAYANGIRDLLEVLGHPRATIVGHSLGGGIAMQFAYQYPERCERLSATDRLYLAAEVPTMIVWGEQDGVIPVTHAHAAHAAIPASRLELFPGAGHFPHRSDPRHFVEVLLDFVRSTAPARLDEARLRERLRSGAATELG